ncbi:MAG: hypothetical protein JRI23_20845 [Deltaproteobacteria bacterium]|jgi:signal transduction histidine kinase/3D (Asp-Asp-Asp) domain-containing protein|nr:hypothetical protein [Deltaproteobacteria bacterium]MBW2534370.1 hypothetical protein [Deltaproteobacteria bacterium]
MWLGIPAGVDTPLGKRLASLTAFRLLVLTTFLAITELYYFKQLAFGGFSSRVAITTIAVAFALAATYAVLLRRGRGLKTMAYAQLLTDQLIWTAIVFISGGVTSGATALYGLTCLSGAILLYTPGALAALAAAVGSYISLCAALVTGVLPPPFDQSASVYEVSLDEMVYPVLSTVMTTAVVTVLAAYLAERLRAFGGRLEAVTARAEKAERLAGLGQLAAALAHEIRNPLGSIRGSVELLRTGPSLSEEDRQLCRIVEREVARLDDLVSDMLHLARPKEPDRAPTDLVDVVRGVVKLARGSSRAAEVSVRYEGPDELEVLADASQMRQVVWNLVRNAMQNSPDGSEATVTLLRLDDGDAALEVRDEGPGIAPSKREQIFEAFYTTRSHGVGIGLAVVRQITERHGFDIDVRSEPEDGSVFRVLVPSRFVLAAMVLLALTAAGCGPSRGWMDPDRPTSSAHGGQDDGWGDSEPSGGSVPAAASAKPDDGAPSKPPPSPGAGGAAAIQVSGSPASGAERKLYRNTYYDFPREQVTPGAPTQTIYAADCQPIRTASKAFHDQLCVQGSGRLVTGQTVSFAKRDCPCAAECPRTGQRICFEALDPKRFPHGRGAMGTAITPLRTVAVDPEEIPLGTVIYIPEYHGLRDLTGKAHDGCFVAEDRGLRVRGLHVDVFTGDPTVTAAWNKAVPSNRGVHVIVGASRCGHLSAGR